MRRPCCTTVQFITVLQEYPHRLSAPMWDWSLTNQSSLCQRIVGPELNLLLPVSSLSSAEQKFTGHVTEVRQILPVFVPSKTSEGRTYFLTCAANDRQVSAW